MSISPLANLTSVRHMFTANDRHFRRHREIRPMQGNQPEALRARERELRDQSVALTAMAIRLRVPDRTRTEREIANLRALLGYGASQRLRGSITAYAETLRRLGEPPQYVIERVRLLADEAMSAAHIGGRAALLAEREALVNQLVLWAVDAYAA
jgi:hypothetical protein